jgi:deferrochelatase/peroxidase EfeB
MGSHVRRANPRDTFENNARLFRPRNDHRLLRRGRPYGPKPDEKANGKKRGLMFLGLNADLERQFEFIQQNWINNPVFAGLAGETDPLISSDGPGRDVFTIGGVPAPHRLCALPQFVTVRGGQYFFLPGIKALERLAGLL